MAIVWQEALGVGRVGVHDDFFELGGHSILAARVCVELEKRLNRRIPLALFFGASKHPRTCPIDCQGTGNTRRDYDRSIANVGKTRSTVSYAFHQRLALAPKEPVGWCGLGSARLCGRSDGSQPSLE